MRISQMNRIPKGKKSNYKPLTNCWFLDYRLKAVHIGILYTIFSQSDKFNMNKTWILDNIGVTPDRKLKAFDDLIEYGYIEVLGNGNNREYIFNEVPYNDLNEYKQIVKVHDKKMGKHTWRKSQGTKQPQNASVGVATEKEVPTINEGSIPAPVVAIDPTRKEAIHNMNTEYYKHNIPPLGSDDPNPPEEGLKHQEDDGTDPYEPMGR